MHFNNKQVVFPMADNDESLSVWSDNIVFRDVALREHYVKKLSKLPAALAQARLMELDSRCGSIRDVFLRQARFLADYEDDFKYNGHIQSFYPVYQSLTDKELRGYFSWRTRLRKGEYCPAPLSFVFLHAYELLNQVGVKDAPDGYEKLCRLGESYESVISYYIGNWLDDYVAYYDLDPSLLKERRDAGHEQAVLTLERAREVDQGTLIGALKELFPNWFARSRFYRERPAEMDAVIFRILKRMCAHYATKCKKNMAEQFFGVRVEEYKNLFNSAVFCDPLKRTDYEYCVDGQCLYKCEDGMWSVLERRGTRKQARKLEGTLKAIDAAMRAQCAYGHPLKTEKQPSWLAPVIGEEIRAHFAEKSARDKIPLDLSRLEKIREDAAVTREKLIVEEEMDLGPHAGAPAVAAKEPPAAPPAKNAPAGLDPVEIRLLRSLLRGENLSWVRSEGHLLSVLVDGINEKLYDVFGDSVLDDRPGLVEDYINDLKEMVEA